MQRDSDKAEAPAKREAPEALDNPEQTLMDQACFCLSWQLSPGHDLSTAHAVTCLLTAPSRPLILEVRANDGSYDYVLMEKRLRAGRW